MPRLGETLERPPQRKVQMGTYIREDQEKALNDLARKRFIKKAVLFRFLIDQGFANLRKMSSHQLDQAFMDWPDE